MLHTYMGFSRSMGMEEGACLIFAHSAKEARKFAYRAIRDWFDGEWVDAAVLRLRDMPWLCEEADQVKLSLGVPHFIERPVSCPGCGQWGHGRIDGECVNCHEWSPEV